NSPNIQPPRFRARHHAADFSSTVALRLPTNCARAERSCFRYGCYPTFRKSGSNGLLLVSRYPKEMRLNEFNSQAFLVPADPGCLPGTSFPSGVGDREAIQRIAGHLGIFFKASATTSTAPVRVRASIAAEE